MFKKLGQEGGEDGEPVTAAVTVYPNAHTKSGETAWDPEPFRSIDDIREWLEAEARALPDGITDKRHTPLYCRGFCEGDRADNVKGRMAAAGPLLVILDVDDQPLAPEEASARLADAGICHYLHTSFSDPGDVGAGGDTTDRRYRVVTDWVVEGPNAWYEMTWIVAQLQRFLQIPLDNCSYSGAAFFVPVHRDGFECFTHSLPGGSTWTPEPWDEAVHGAGTGAGGAGKLEASPDTVREFDDEEVWDALGSISNFDRDTWVTVGQAMHSTGQENARELWDDWSTEDGTDGAVKFNEADQDRVWASFGKNTGPGVSLSTIFHMAEAGGWVNPARGAAAAAALTPDQAAEFFSDVFVDPPEDPIDRAEGLLLSISTPYKSAASYIDICAPNLIRSNGEFIDYVGPAYKVLEEASVRSRVYAFLDKAKCRKKVDDVFVIEPFKPAPARVNAVIDSLQARAHKAKDVSSPPVWLEGSPDRRPRPKATEIIACQNGLLHVPTGELIEATPDFFTLNAVPFAFNPDAPEPVQWIRFLGQGFGSDETGRESIQLLQEWFGYSAVMDNSLQKILMIQGPKRSGKGTIAKVLTAMVGSSNVCFPNARSLKERFGLQPFIGKQLAIFADMQPGRSERLILTETLKGISGGDSFTIDRKGISEWTGTLSPRLVLMSNEFPTLSDPSGAVTSRFLPLQMVQSFYDREDLGLGKRLLTELPGILNWAIEGYQRLCERGHFHVGGFSRELIKSMEDSAAPIRSFMEDDCELGGFSTRDVKTLGFDVGDFTTQEDALYQAWKLWCARNGHESGSKTSFRSKMKSAFRKVHRCRPGRRGAQVWTYRGVRLRPREITSDMV